ncbi:MULTISPECIES: class I SAM-dependent methyltransferase [Spirulina sp. CCY15215]|uniref:class I SAM-dependent methyltransferase n=1 Tax=Spirulina sp. CCY15215 TaxID=2767591 RepID=UPI0019511E2C|nr:class I SAM-dependent methyltransferase [Spirulina major]
MNNWQKQKQWYASQDLEIRKTWYSSVAEAYNRVRPRYPQELCDRAIEVVQLRPDATILEIGSGPGNATIGFAKLGFSMVCLEPSRESCQFLESNCSAYPQIEIMNTSFEEWKLEPEKFDVVLAANSFHWIPPEVSYGKTANALKQEGHLILLWNLQPEPRYEEYTILQEVYQKYAPSLSRYEGRNKQEEVLKNFGDEILKSGQFQDLISEQIPCQVTYSVDDYLLLLDTFSPYQRIEKRDRELLFIGLRERIEKNFYSKIEFSYLSAFHIARKISF